MKNFIALASIAAGVVAFTFGPAHAFVNDGSTSTNHNGSLESTTIGNGEARGVANFTMSFSGSGTTKGDFKNDGMMQNIFGGQSEERPYYYNVR
jgi:hypothetical protein